MSPWQSRTTGVHMATSQVEQAPLRILLAGLIPDELLDAYTRLLEQDGCAASDAAEFVGNEELAEELLERGMAHTRPHSVTGPARFEPARPDLALSGILAGLQSRLVKDQQLLLEGHQRLTDLQTGNVPGLPTLRPDAQIEVLTEAAEISRLSFSLINSARSDWMTVETHHFELPPDAHIANEPLPSARDQVKCRGIYDAECVHDPVLRQGLLECIAAGEKARVRPEVAMKMKIADRSTAMLPLTATGMSGALVIRSPVIVSALREYFELMWEHATPVGANPPGGKAMPEGRKSVLTLLAQGYTDERIASSTGMSKTTVHRHVKAIMQELDADSRFAAGAAAQRRGWLN